MAAFLSTSGLTLAHQNHDEMKAMEISQSDAIDIATNEVNNQIADNQLDVTWGSVDSKSAMLERKQGRQVWKVVFNQVAAGDTIEVMTVYVSKTGEFISLSK